METNMLSNYLIPVEDGEVMRSSGPWAEEKLDYLKRYIDVFETAMRSRFSHRFYIDLLAGPGKNLVRNPKKILLGSPLLAITAKYPFTGYYFVDIDDLNIAALRTRCSAADQNYLINIVHGDCNSLVEKIVANVKRYDSESLNLAFLDPAGLELQWNTVAKLGTIRRIDLIINYPQNAISRNIRQAFESPNLTVIDQFFGSSDWRNIYKRYSKKPKLSSIHREFMDFYKSRLATLGYQEIKRDDETGDEPLMHNAQKKVPLYRLLFASKNELGVKFWQDITKRNVHGQKRFF
jgi:three-Cys-motif partner protein